MVQGQKVRFRPGSAVGRGLDIPADAIGLVICRYRVIWEGDSAPERLDVRFEDRRFAWGVPEREFEPISRSNDA